MLVITRTECFCGSEGHLTYVKHFSNPTCSPDGVSPWPAVHKDVLNYQRINTPGIYSNSGPTEDQADMIRFFDEIEAKARLEQYNLQELNLFNC